MDRLTIATLLAGLAATVTAQSNPVVSVFLLDSDPEALVGSVVGQANSLTTLSVNCAAGNSDTNCGYPSGFALTYGPSTVIVTAIADQVTGIFACAITGTTQSGECGVTYAGPANSLTDVLDTDATVTDTAVTTVSTNAALEPGDITLAAITITAGGLSATATGGSASASASASAAPSNGSSGTGSAAAGGSSSSAAPLPPQQPSNASGAAGSGNIKSSPAASGDAGQTKVSQAPSSSSTGVTPLTQTKNVGSYLVAPGLIGAALLGIVAYL